MTSHCHWERIVIIVIDIGCYRHRYGSLSSSASVVIVIGIGRYRHRYRSLSSSVSVVTVIGIGRYRHRYRSLSSSESIVIVIGIVVDQLHLRLLASVKNHTESWVTLEMVRRLLVDHELFQVFFSEMDRQGSKTINSKQFRIIVKTRLCFVIYKVLACFNLSKDTKYCEND